LKTLKIIGQVIGYSVLCILIFIIGYNFVSKVILKQNMTVIFGYSSAVVVSSSMSPTLQVNDYIVTHQQADYAVGDIICFLDDDDMVVTHRVSRIEEVDGIEYFYTKGDAVDSEDLDPKTLDKIYGKIVWVMAGFGNVFAFFQSVWGIIVIISAIALIFLVSWYVKSLKEEKESIGGSKIALENNEQDDKKSKKIALNDTDKEEKTENKTPLEKDKQVEKSKKITSKDMDKEGKTENKTPLEKDKQVEKSKKITSKDKDKEGKKTDKAVNKQSTKEKTIKKDKEETITIKTDKKSKNKVIIIKTDKKLEN